mmetsp:Transcript_54934/g.91518  ORF Transcript_54934/g.91518 Transcript_54934/m.91518 type:complete len:388 (+) Transcript_54934:30-1193(+)
MVTPERRLDISAFTIAEPTDQIGRYGKAQQPTLPKERAFPSSRLLLGDLHNHLVHVDLPAAFLWYVALLDGQPTFGPVLLHPFAAALHPHDVERLIIAGDEIRNGAHGSEVQFVFGEEMAGQVLSLHRCSIIRTQLVQMPYKPRILEKLLPCCKDRLQILAVWLVRLVCLEVVQRNRDCIIVGSSVHNEDPPALLQALVQAPHCRFQRLQWCDVILGVVIQEVYHVDGKHQIHRRWDVLFDFGRLFVEVLQRPLVDFAQSQVTGSFHSPLVRLQQVLVWLLQVHGHVVKAAEQRHDIPGARTNVPNMCPGRNAGHDLFQRVGELRALCVPKESEVPTFRVRLHDQIMESVFVDLAIGLTRILLGIRFDAGLNGLLKHFARNLRFEKK